MKNFKLIALVALAVLASSLTFAQTGPPHQGGGGMMRGGGQQMMEIEAGVLKKIGASADQIKKVNALHEKEKADMKAWFDKNKDSMKPPAGGGRPTPSPEMQKQFKAFRDGHIAAMKKILGGKYSAYETEMKAQMKAHSGGGAPAGGPTSH